MFSNPKFCRFCSGETIALSDHAITPIFNQTFFKMFALKHFLKRHVGKLFF